MFTCNAFTTTRTCRINHVSGLEDYCITLTVSDVLHMVDLTTSSGQECRHGVSRDGVAKEGFSVRIYILRLLGIRTNERPINETRISDEASSMLFAPLTLQRLHP
jgi:hypothetical protein